MAHKKRKLIEKLQDKYKLVILNNDTYEESASFTLNRIGLFAAGSVLVIVLFVLTMLLLMFTPLREYIPGYADPELRREVAETAFQADSLEAVLTAQKAYINNIQQVLDGSVGDSSVQQPQEELDTHITDQINLTSSSEDSAFRAFIEDRDSYQLNRNAPPREKTSIIDHTFFTPVSGIVTQPFDLLARHYGIDVACKKDEPIKTILEGRVVFSGFTAETGHVIAIQHSNDIISFYKHCSVIFKKVGSFVKSGEAIAIVGNTGALSSGPHLHFEIWYQGNPVNPADYMRF